MNKPNFFLSRSEMESAIYLRVNQGDLSFIGEGNEHVVFGIRSTVSKCIYVCNNI